MYFLYVRADHGMCFLYGRVGQVSQLVEQVMWYVSYVVDEVMR